MEGIERIKVLSSEIQDEALLEIVNYLLSREDMDNKYLNENKSLKQMIDYIMEQARKLSKNNRAIVKDEVVFGWAIHYWDESNTKLGLKTDKNKEDSDDEEVDMSYTSKPKENKVQQEKKWQPEGQLTLFDFVNEE